MNLMKMASQPVVSLDVRDHCQRAAELMTQCHFHHLPVLDEGVPVGMLSDRDLLSSIGRWAHAQRLDSAVPDWAHRLPVVEIMSAPLIGLSPDDSLEKAARLMLDEKVSAVPVLDGSNLLGIVTETDLLLRISTEQHGQRQSVQEHMMNRVIHISPEEPIRTAWRLMRDKQIRHLVVLKNAQVVGILSDRDLRAGITWSAAGPHGIQDRVECIMTGAVTTIDLRATLCEAAGRMLAAKIGALPVTDQTRLVGIITKTDLVRAFLELAE